MKGWNDRIVAILRRDGTIGSMRVRHGLQDVKGRSEPQLAVVHPRADTKLSAKAT